MSKLSVIIPVYNESPYLHRCLDSVVAALPEDDLVDVVVVDDGSTDGSGEICDEYAQAFQVIHITNSGVSVARNTGLAHAAGEWITFLDSDDEMKSDGINVMLEAIENSPDEKIIEFNHQRYYFEIDKLVTKYKSDPGIYACDNGMAALPQCWCMVWNKLYRRDLLEKHYIRFLSGLQYGEDEMFNLRCFEFWPRILHISKTAITRHFDNKQSLAHTVGESKLLAQTRALCDLIEATENDSLHRLIRD